MKALVFDLETTMRGEGLPFSATPHYPHNEVVMCGWTWAFSGFTLVHTHDGLASNLLQPAYQEADLLVAHNIKFDLGYVREVAFALPDAHLWDTQYAHYILTGHSAKTASLQEVYDYWCKDKRGATHTKGSVIEDALAAGVPIEDIDKEELRQYLVTDVEMTTCVFEEQYKAAQEAGKHKVILMFSDTIKALIEIEHNGLTVDQKQLEQLEQVTSEACDEAEEALRHALRDEVGFQHGFVAHKDATIKDKALEGIMYEGEFKAKAHVPTGEVYKSGTRRGQTKTRIEEVTVLVPESVPRLTPKSDGSRPTDRQARQAFLDALPNPDALDIGGVNVVAVYHDAAEAKKLLGTYVKPWLNMANKFGGKIHANYNMCQTATGRLSSSNPNFQNIPSATTLPNGSKVSIKSAVVASDTDKVLAEIDYSQLEVVVAAYWSGDPQLISDLKDGVDIHDAVAEELGIPVPMDKKTRRNVKGVVFGTIYGGGAETIAAQSGMDKKFVKDVQRAFHKRYPYIGNAAKGTLTSLEEMASFGAGVRSGTNQPIRTSDFVLPTQRTIRFKEYPRKHGGGYGFSYTQAANYPVQAIATADIVPLTLGRVYRYLQESKFPAKLVNTVHDSIMLEVPLTEQGEAVLREVVAIMEDAPNMLKVLFDIDFPLETPVEVEVGSRWSELVSVDINSPQ